MNGCSRSRGADTEPALGPPGVIKPQTAGLGVYHGFRREHFQAYFDEFESDLELKAKMEKYWEGEQAFRLPA